MTSSSRFPRAGHNAGLQLSDIAAKVGRQEDSYRAVGILASCFRARCLLVLIFILLIKNMSSEIQKNIYIHFRAVFLYLRNILRRQRLQVCGRDTARWCANCSRSVCLFKCMYMCACVFMLKAAFAFGLSSIRIPCLSKAKETQLKIRRSNKPRL